VVLFGCYGNGLEALRHVGLTVSVISPASNRFVCLNGAGVKAAGGYRAHCSGQGEVCGHRGLLKVVFAPAF
tara:strand:+ start:95 stop:307 length:213 start_codon:yes stop_codon:yes gene_type:complete